jgi:hypothetical protein
MQVSSPVETTVPDRVKITTVVGANSSDPYPMLDCTWDMFAGKGIRTVFVSIGNSKSVQADLEIAEGLGCPINAVALSNTETAQWEEVSKILKERKRGEESVHDFSVGAETKWILPKNIRLQPALPWWTKGQIDLSASTVKTETLNAFATSICTTMKVKDNITRIDILKIDTVAVNSGLEKGILGAVLSAGFRPCIILVHWSERPDVDLSTTLAAGHLQNAGYQLLWKIDNKFLYYYNDNDMYQICSWEENYCQNPMFNEIVRSASLMQSKSSQLKEGV